MAETRKGEVTFKGNPVELVGPKLKAGDKAPDFTCVGAGLAVRHAGRHRRARPGCSTWSRRSTPRSATSRPSSSPRSSRRWATRSRPTPSASTCRSPRPGSAPRPSIENVKNLSDAHNHSFGEHYGVLIQGLPIPLLARAVFVVDPSNKITYVEIVPEIANEPDYEPALKALKAAAGA